MGSACLNGFSRVARACATAGMARWLGARPTTGTPRCRSARRRTVAAGSTTRIEWLGPSDLGADQGLSPSRDRARDVEKEFLASVLADVPVAANAVLRRADEEGIPHRTLHRAKKQLSIESARTGSVWEWSLNGCREPEPGVKIATLPRRQKWQCWQP